MCDKEKLIFLNHSNINPKTHLNKSKLHLDRNGYEKLVLFRANCRVLNKMHQVVNYQDFLTWGGGGGILRSFSYNY